MNRLVLTSLALAALTLATPRSSWSRNDERNPAVSPFDPNSIGHGAGQPAQASCIDWSPFGQALQDIGNLHVVPNGTVYRGSEPDAQGMADLAALKIKTDIDLEGGDIHSLDPVYDAYDYIAEPGERKSSILAEKKEAQSHGIRFVNIPLNAYEQVTPAEALRIDRILRIMHNPKNQPVYVHCEHGKDRTGLIMALYAVKYLHESPAQAHAEMVADGHSGSVDQLVTHQMDVYFWQIAPAYAKDNP